MSDFPEFMKNPVNRIAKSSQATPGVEGYVFDGADGSQMAFWTCRESASSARHVHPYDEYMVVVEGCYTAPHRRRADSGAGGRGVPHSARGVARGRGGGGNADDPRIRRAPGGANAGRWLGPARDWMPRTI